MRGIRRHPSQQRAARLAAPGGGGYAAPSQVSGGQASPPAVAVMPVAQVLVYGTAPGYVTVAYRGLQPLWAPDGETILSTAPGRWGQLAAAGRP